MVAHKSIKKRILLLFLCVGLFVVTDHLFAQTVCHNKDLYENVQSRKVHEWPFAWDSIWNMPIGCNAKYVDAKLVKPGSVDSDTDIFVKTKKSDPLVPIYYAGGIPGNTSKYIYGKNTDRCRGSVSLGKSLKVHFPYSVVVSSVGKNYSTAILDSDGDTLRQLNAFARCRKGGPIYGLNRSATSCTESIRGSGIKCFGGHGGTGLSSIGGTLRAIDWERNGPIRHALKINLRPYQYYMNRSQKKCQKRWPAKKCDNDISKYKRAPFLKSSTVPANKEGALLAIPPNVTASDLGIKTAAGRKMFDVLQDYGVYTVDGSGTNRSYIRNSYSQTKEAENAFKRKYGYNFNVYKNSHSAWAEDQRKLIQALHVVDDNNPHSIGGKGDARRAPYAPSFKNDTDTTLPDIGTPPSNTRTTCKESITAPHTAIQSFGYPYDYGRTLIKAQCVKDNVTHIEVGDDGDNDLYIYGTAYTFNKALRTWEAVALECATRIQKFCRGGARKDLTRINPKETNYIAAYICKYDKQSRTFDCGCRDNICERTNAPGLWRVQKIQAQGTL